MSSTTTESQNGTRQPQLISASSGSAAIGMNTMVESTMPEAYPVITKEVKNPRLPSGECSTVRVEAPAASAPAENPWANLPTTNRAVAHQPSCS